MSTGHDSLLVKSNGHSSNYIDYTASYSKYCLEYVI